MPPALLRIAAIALLTACAHTDAAARSDSAHGAKSPPATGAVAAPASTANPHDSITDLADRGRILGDSSAKVWVLMASDFQCPFCKEWHDANFASLVKSYVDTKRIRLAFINMPLSMHPNAVPAAEAAMCASVQNKFWPMHEALFASQSTWEELPDPKPKLDSIAASIGVAMPAWRDCVSHHSTLALIQADHDRIRNAGVNSTPTFFVAGKMIVNNQGLSAGAGANVAGAIDAALKGGAGGASSSR
ncbi:MAG TPA: thioredoxin domain-containing protein [Gemmatimonadaceae bacterium]|nr:thioredoxin domain-containing protein [Gemmatimonadaceae bacterium]